MIIGVPKEVKDHEFRVSLTPDGARALCAAGHTVWVESSAGDGSGFSDEVRKHPPDIGATVTYTYRGLTRNGVPRFASYLRVREKF